MGAIEMNIKNVKTGKKDENIDNKVISAALDEKQWGKAVKAAPKTKPTSIRLSERTIEKAKFFAKIHHERGYQSWIKKIIEEHVNTEYELYKSLKKELA